MKKKTILALGLAVAMTFTAMPAAAAELDIQSVAQEETADFSDEAADVEISEEEIAAETDEASVEVEADEDAEATALEASEEDADETLGGGRLHI